jgi:hypothetical protein
MPGRGELTTQTILGVRAMPLSDAEREHIIEVERLKDEVRQLLQIEPPAAKFSKFCQHPAVLLLLGFALTDLAGTFLVSQWKQDEWRNQQNYLVAQRTLDRKAAVIEATFKEVAATIAAADDLLAIYYPADWSKKDVDERWENWKKTSLNWRVQSKVLSARLATSFSKQDVQTTFKEIVDQRKQLGNIIVNLPRPIKRDKDTAAQVQQATTLVNHISELLNKCGLLMGQELPVSEHHPN